MVFLGPMAVSSGFLLFHTQFLSLGTQDPSLGYAKSVGVLLAACSRLAVPYILIYASCGLAEGRDRSRHFTYRAIEQNDGRCQRYASKVSEQSPAVTDDYNYATMRNLLEFLPSLLLSELSQSSCAPPFYLPVRSFVLHYFLVPRSTTAPASPLRFKAAM